MGSTSKPLVLITGTSGMLGFRTLVLTLQAGYRVRIALRKKAQAEKIKNTTSVKTYAADTIEVVEVPDMTAANAYDEAVQGVDHILHVASPMPTKPEHQTGSWREIYYTPAIEGTLSILRAAAKTSTVKTVVITSSIFTLQAPEGKDRAGPGDLIPPASDEVADKIEHPNMAYGMSKVLAHHAANNFARENKVNFNLIRVLPGLIQGAHELAESESDLFATTNMGTLNAVLGNVTPTITSQTFLDDAAKAHVLSLDSDKGHDGDVFVIVGNGGNCIPWKEYGTRAAKLFPKQIESGLFRPEKVAEHDGLLRKFDVASSEEKLGFNFAGPEETAKGVIEQYLRFLRDSAV